MTEQQALPEAARTASAPSLSIDLWLVAMRSFAGEMKRAAARYPEHEELLTTTAAVLMTAAGAIEADRRGN